MSKRAEKLKLQSTWRCAVSWTFLVGIDQKRRVKVYTREGYEKACRLAREELDRRAEKSGQEPPVAWELTLLRAF